MSVAAEKLNRLRTVITENLRVQRDGKSIDYINIGNALQNYCARQNHAIFARRGCGKTLLLHHSARVLPKDVKAVYLNCEDFKQHSFPNVLIEILVALFRELEQNLGGWFGKRRQSKKIIQDIIRRLEQLQQTADVQDEDVRRKSGAEMVATVEGGAGAGSHGLNLKLGAKNETKEKQEIERSFKVHREKLQELDRWLPEFEKKYQNVLFTFGFDEGSFFANRRPLPSQADGPSIRRRLHSSSL